MAAPERSVVPLTTEQQAVVTENLGLAFHAVGRLRRTRPDIPSDEALSIAFIALCRTPQTYRADRGTAFATWFYWQVRAAVSKYDRSISPAGFKREARTKPPRTYAVSGDMIGRLIDDRFQCVS